MLAGVFIVVYSIAALLTVLGILGLITGGLVQSSRDYKSGIGLFKWFTILGLVAYILIGRLLSIESRIFFLP